MAEDFEKLVKKFLKDEKYSECRELILAPPYQKHIPAVSWDLIPAFSTCLTAENALKFPHLTEICGDIFEQFVTLGNPKELMLGFLEQAGAFIDEVRYLTLLKPIQKVLLKLPSKRHNSLQISLETLYGYIGALKEPEDYKLEKEERKFLENDPKVSQINTAVDALVDFLKPFVHDISVDVVRENSLAIINERKDLVIYLIKLLEFPMVYLDLSHDPNDGDAKRSTGRVIAQRIISMISKLQHDFYKTLSWMLAAHSKDSVKKMRKAGKLSSGALDEIDEVDEWEKEQQAPIVGMSCFAYLLFCENVGIDKFPSVFTHPYVFESNIVFMCVMMHKTHSVVIEKGVALAETLVKRIPKGEWEPEILESKDFAIFVDYITRVLINCPVQDLRSRALKLIPIIVSRFNAYGRSQCLFLMLNKAARPGHQGYIIQLIKDEIHANLQSPSPSEAFSARALQKFYNLVFAFPEEGPHTDLLSQSDRVMAVLNFFRYLILRDPSHVNVTGIWNVVDQIEKVYIAPLLHGFKMSKNHIEAELKMMQQGLYNRKVRDDKGADVGIAIAGTLLPSMPKSQKMQVLQVGLNTFEMMGIVLGRVTDLLATLKRGGSPTGLTQVTAKTSSLEVTGGTRSGETTQETDTTGVAGEKVSPTVEASPDEETSSTK
ncbi:glomulin isoform X1 [Lingula anatina]|uniref:Glomulin isoform X1 n=1 Tax=Lingula anatina TaxID=7574 RepID=A0A1S3H597_LINAN|nr:glomulin isoform X1 [Lingula anatina]|eukprot:XP_013380309.1 glomulin isoform X1 [Lingula anatina]